MAHRTMFNLVISNNSGGGVFEQLDMLLCYVSEWLQLHIVLVSLTTPARQRCISAWLAAYALV